MPRLPDVRLRLAAVAVLLAAWLLRVWELPSLPPGLHHDEAIEGLNALEVLGGTFRFWFPAGGGREPLFMYLAAGAVGVLGPTAFALRLLAAAFATLAVAASFALGRRLFDGPTALVAAVLMATSYWQIHTGRLGLRSALLAPLAALAFALLLRAIDRRSSWVVAAAGGALLGSTVYTYFAARLLPVVALAVLAIEVAARRDRATVRAAAAFAGAAALTAAPMIAYVLLAPASANERVNEASVFAQPDARAALRESVVGVLRMFALRGDEMWKYNLDARPLFSPALALLAALGALLSLATRRGWAALVWLGVMCLPSALATESPHFIRIAGLAPVLFLFPALPLVWVGRRLPRLAALGLVALLLATGGATWRDYFVTWARSPETGPAFAHDMAAAAAALRAARPGDPVYLSVDPYEPRQLVVRYLAAPIDLHWYDGRRGLVLPAQPSVQAFPRSARPPPGWLERVGGATPLHRGELVDLWRIEPPRLDAAPLARFGDALELLRAEPPPSVRADEVPTLLLALRPGRRLPDDLTLFVHVDDERGGWGGRDDRFYLTTNREAGETIVAAFQAPLDPGTPPGEYRLEMGIYRRDGVRLRTPDGRDHLDVARLLVEPAGRAWTGPDVPPSEHVAPPLAPGAQPRPDPARPFELVPGLLLRSATVAPREARPGDRVTVATYWQRGPGAAPLRACDLVVTASVGDRAVAASASPLSRRHPPPAWVVGELVQERTFLQLAPDAPAGAAVVSLAACGVPLDLGHVQVAGLRRSTERPTPSIVREATFGTFARLLGYGLEVEQQTSGTRLTLALYWAADGASERPLTVFTQLLDEGDRVRGQHDGPPVDGTRPTTGWTAGEYFVDVHRLSVDPAAVPGEFLLQVGLYDPVTGVRTPVAGGGDRVILERRRL